MVIMECYRNPTLVVNSRVSASLSVSPMMASMGRPCLKYNSLLSFRCVLLPQFCYSTRTAATPPISSSNQPNSLSFLKDCLVGSLGFSEEHALYVSAKLAKSRQYQRDKVCDPNFLENAELVISYLEQKGLDKPQIRNLVYSTPKILVCRIQQNLEPKMKFFQDVGLSVSDSADIISVQPRILHVGLHSNISPAVDALRAIVGSNENLVRVIKGFKFKCHWTLITKNLVYNVSSLRARGVPIESIQKRILVQSTTFMLKPRVFEDIVARAEAKWGISPRSSMFLYAVRLLASCNEKNIESKCRVFESFGWERSHVVDLFRKNPSCFACSERNIEATLRFFMNELGYGPSYIVAHPAVLLYSLEKRVLPRHIVLHTLKEKRLLKENSSLYTAVVYTESKFLRKFVFPFQDAVPNLHEVYVNSKSYARTNVEKELRSDSQKPNQSQ